MTRIPMLLNMFGSVSVSLCPSLSVVFVCLSVCNLVCLSSPCLCLLASVCFCPSLSVSLPLYPFLPISVHLCESLPSLPGAVTVCLCRVRLSLSLSVGARTKIMFLELTQP